MRLLTKYGKIHSNKNVRRRSSTQYLIYFDFSSTISRSTQEVSMTPRRRKTAPNSTTFRSIQEVSMTPRRRKTAPNSTTFRSILEVSMTPRRRKTAPNSTTFRSILEVSMTPRRRKTAPNSTTSPLPFDLSYFHLPFGYQLRITRELWSINPHKSSELITDIIHFRVGRYSCALVQIYSHRRSFAELNLNSVETKINISKHEVTIDKQKYAHG